MTDAPPANGAGGPTRDFARFAAIDAWIFDLDNTLYPRDTNLYTQVDERIRSFVAKLLDIPPDEAQRVQKDYYRRYGTTLRGLMVERGIEPDAFLDYVHDIDHSAVAPDPALAAAIERLPGRKFIMTNGSRAHAERIAGRIGITGHFDEIFDIVAAELLPKPNRETYDRFIAVTGIRPGAAAMFEDLARNLVVPQALGMATVLVVPAGTQSVFTEEWELEGREAAHVEFLTDHLSGFLEQVLAAIAAGSA
jgi:putative hydrolase of the HAD superfamily